MEGHHDAVVWDVASSDHQSGSAQAPLELEDQEADSEEEELGVHSIVSG